MGKARATTWPEDEIWPQHVLLGVTVENQKAADTRVPILLEVPGRCNRFLSVEPMLGPVNLYNIYCFRDGISWVIAGGESGPGARPMKMEWARSLRDQCEVAAIPFFFKQNSGITSRDRHTIPDDLMIREFPKLSKGVS